MQNSLLSTQTAFVTCRQLPAVGWQPGVACAFTDELAVFRFAVLPSATLDTLFEHVLTPAERVRANRYHQPADRLRFVSGRGLLRTVAGNYTQKPPDQMQLTVGMNNKPELGNAPGLCVNLAHAGNWVVLAVGRESVGIDVEIMNHSIDYQPIADTIFGLAEQQELSQTTEPKRLFYDYWTRKEALLKATGLGIIEDLHQVPACNGTHRVSAKTLGGAGAWLVEGFAVDDAHPAALAHRPTTTSPVFYSLTPGNLL